MKCLCQDPAQDAAPLIQSTHTHTDMWSPPTNPRISGQPAVLPETLTMIHEHRETHSKHTLKISLISARIICLVVPESGVACCCIAQTSFPVFVRLSVVCCCGIFRGLGPSRVSGVCFGESTYK